MKKLLFIFLIFALLFFCGCSAKSETLTAVPSPGIIPETEPAAMPDENIGKLRISELMVKNRSSLTDEDEDFSDWIELENCSDELVELSGWSISDGDSKGWALPAASLEPGEFILIFASGKDRLGTELHTDFRLSRGETVSLLTPMGNVSHSVYCENDNADYSLVIGENSFVECSYPSPGFENSPAGYEAWQNSLVCNGPLIISEVVVSNIFESNYVLAGQSDWVEIKNISSDSIQLSEYYLSDDHNDYRLWQLPERELPAGKTMLILCEEDGSKKLPCAPFELSSSSETLYLSRGNELVDYMFLRNIPIGGSYGRMDGEPGFFYFTSSTPKKKNNDGLRRISQSPVSKTRDGVFNDVDSVTVELESEGKIYYTLDGSLPNTDSREYEGPFAVDSTCVVRAISVEDGALPSKALSLSFIINENHSLPVISIVSDSPGKLKNLFRGKNTVVELPGSISFFEDEGAFSLDCGISLSGHQSLELSKKSMKISFRGVYGQDSINYDLFGTGQTRYDSLAIRAGQDNHRLVFRQEIWQDLCLEMTDLVPTQHSKFCIAYINGKYYGIYCIKENISPQYFADLEGVSRDSVESIKVPDAMTLEFKDSVFTYCRLNDMSLPEHYEYICGILDIDSFIDWIILQGVSANVDLFRNVRFFRSVETDGKWKSVLFDLDHAMLDDFGYYFVLGRSLPEDDWPFMSIMGESSFSNSRISLLFNKLLENPEFRDRLLSRYGEVYDSYLSNERILERIDHYQQLLEPEIERDWTRWNENPKKWYIYLDMFRRAVTELDWQNYAKDSFCRYLSLGEEEIAHYFG